MLCQINYYHTIYNLCSVLIVLVCGMTLIAREIAEATTLELGFVRVKYIQTPPCQSISNHICQSSNPSDYSTRTRMLPICMTRLYL